MSANDIWLQWTASGMVAETRGLAFLVFIISHLNLNELFYYLYVFFCSFSTMEWWQKPQV